MATPHRWAPALLVLGLAGCGGDAPRDEPAPGPGPSPSPAPDARARRELTTLRELVEADPAVAAALALTGRVESAEARRRWQAGREAFRHLVRRHDLAAILARLAAPPPTPASFHDLGRLALAARLLDRAHPAGDEPLFPAGQDPGLAKGLARGVEVRLEPAIDPRVEAGTPAGRDTYMGRISAGGRRWRTLRSLEDTWIPDGPAKGFNSRIWKVSPGGERFLDPTEGIPAVMLGAVYPERDQLRLAAAAERIEAALDAPPADLYLLLLAWNLQGLACPTLELTGRELTVTVPVPPPEGAAAALGLHEHLPAGLAIRVRAEVLPPGLRKLTVRMVALQPIGRPEASCNATELLQQVGGPPPAVFEGHGWPAAPADPDAP